MDVCLFVSNEENKIEYFFIYFGATYTFECKGRFRDKFKEENICQWMIDNECDKLK